MATLAVAGMLAATFSSPARVNAQRGSPNLQYDQHHAAAPEAAAPQALKPDMPGMMARMKASGERLDALVKEMNAATGPAKTDAIARVLTALVEDRRTMCEPMMAHMTSMMNTSGEHAGHTEAAPDSK